MESFTPPPFTRNSPDTSGYTPIRTCQVEGMPDFSKEENRKFDQGKTRYDLIPAGPLEALAKVYTMGAAKYEDNGWRKGIKWGRVFAAIMRHLWAFWRGQDKDDESGMSHLAHAAWGCFTLLEYNNTRGALDDRYSDPNLIKTDHPTPSSREVLAERIRHLNAEQASLSAQEVGARDHNLRQAIIDKCSALSKKQREDVEKEGVWIDTEPLGLPGKVWIPKGEVPALVALVLKENRAISL